MGHVFLSYARDDFDSELQGFISELRDNVASLAGLRKDEVLFRDYESIPLGEEWSPALAAGIATCSVFLAVYTPKYFGRQYCGKEWTAFDQRIQKTPDPAKAQQCRIPLWWVPLEYSTVNLPNAAAKIQDAGSPLPPGYREAGLRSLRMTLDEPQYKGALLSFAKLVAGPLREHRAGRTILAPLPANSDIGNFADAFSHGAAAPAAAPLGANGGRGVRKRVWFAIVAGTQNNLQGMRTDLSSYDSDDPLQWRPFDSERPITFDLHEAAQAELLNAEVDELPELPDALDAALQARERQPAIVVADPWSVGLPQYRNTLAKLDSLFSPNLGAVVPVLDDDAETPQQSNARDTAFHSLFRRRLSGVDKDTFYYPLSTKQDLVPELRRLIAQLRQRILASLAPPRGGPFPKRQILQGPG